MSTGQNSKLDAGFLSPDGNAYLVIRTPESLPSRTRINAVRNLSANLSDRDLLNILGNDASVADAPKPAAVVNADAAATAPVAGTLPDAGPFQMILLYAIRNETGYLVGLASLRDYAAQNQALIQQVLQSFQLTP